MKARKKQTGAVRTSPQRLSWTAAALCFVIVVAILIPSLILRTLNRHLERVPGYQGHVEKLTLTVFSPGVVLHGFTFRKEEAVAPGAFIRVHEMKATLSWLPLLIGRLVLTLDLYHPEAEFLLRERRPGQPKHYGLWKKPFESFPPFRVRRLRIHDGVLRFKNDEAIPPIDLRFTHLNVAVSNFANVEKRMASPETRVSGVARMQDQAPVELEMAIRPFREHASFELAGSLNEFDLTNLNNAIEHYTGLELKKGLLSMQLSMKVANGEFNGTVEREIGQLTVNKSPKKPLKLIKQNVAQVLMNLKKDDETKKIEKDFEFSGPLGYLTHDVVLAAVWVVKGAFIQSLRPGLPTKVRTETPEKVMDDWSQLQAKKRAKASH